jgi:enamine deaminase RidA (YjgF/YER057c/UK114 family)
MRTRTINAADAPVSVSGYAQAVEASDVGRILYISGQIPMAADGAVPADFLGQSRQAWANVEAQLCAAGMTLDNLVKVTIFLSDRRHADENRQVRKEVLGARSPALTVIITGIFDESWLLEIEAVAMA